MKTQLTVCLAFSLDSINIQLRYQLLPDAWHLEVLQNAFK